MPVEKSKQWKVVRTIDLNASAEKVWNIVGQENGHLYVCGDAKMMAKDVHNIIEEIVREKGGVTREEAEAFVKKMEQNIMVYPDSTSTEGYNLSDSLNSPQIKKLRPHQTFCN